MNILERFNAKQMELVNNARDFHIPEFRAGDELIVSFKISEGAKDKIEKFKGICIARRNRGYNSTFVMRKLSAGEYVEKIYPVYSPNIMGIEVLKCGKVRRAKLYYLRDRSGKSARIAESRHRKASDINKAAIAKQDAGVSEKQE